MGGGFHPRRSDGNPLIEHVGSMTAMPASQERDVPTIVILAAGIGTRLGRPHPKPLTKLKDGRSILQQQLDNIHDVFGDDARIMIVVGFKLDLILEAAPDCTFVYNESFDRTNTSKSLLKALRLSPPGGVLWMNGDVVFDPEVLRRVAPLAESGQSFVCVNTAQIGEEEVTYTLDADGYVSLLAKGLTDGLGEAVGINHISGADKAALIAHLADCEAQDYFEKGVQTAVAEHGLRVSPIDISDLFAVEIDFEEDLARANRDT